MKMFGLGGAKPAPTPGEAETEMAEPLKVTKKVAESASYVPPQVCASALSCACRCARTRACVMYFVPIL